jgi:hypothetical protein
LALAAFEGLGAWPELFASNDKKGKLKPLGN